MGPTWGPSGSDRTQVGPILAPWTLLSGYEQHFMSGLLDTWYVFPQIRLNLWSQRSNEINIQQISMDIGPILYIKLFRKCSPAIWSSVAHKQYRHRYVMLSKYSRIKWRSEYTKEISWPLTALICFGLVRNKLIIIISFRVMLLTLYKPCAKSSQYTHVLWN